jgi:hypothetical protein
LGYNHRGAGAQAHEKAYGEVQQHSGAAAHGCQSLGAHELAHHHGVHRVIELLEQHAHRYGAEKAQQLFPYDALGKVVFVVCKFHRQLPEKVDALVLYSLYCGLFNREML